jgi:hypothetical protein
VVEPGLRGDETIALLEKLQGQVVESPHPFLAADRGGGEGEDEGQSEDAQNESGAILLSHRLPPEKYGIMIRERSGKVKGTVLENPGGINVVKNEDDQTEINFRKVLTIRKYGS